MRRGDDQAPAFQQPKCPAQRALLEEPCSKSLYGENQLTAAAVSRVAQTLVSACSAMVSSVEPVRHRIQPSRIPPRKICRMPNQSYWMCITDQAAEVSRMAGQIARGEVAQPRNRKPRNMIS